MKSRYKNKDDDIVVKNDLLIKNAKKNEYSFDMFIVLSGVLSVFIILLSSFKIGCNREYLILLIVLFSFIMSFTLRSNKKKRITLIILLVYLVSGIILFKKIYQGGGIVVAAIFKVLKYQTNISFFNMKMKTSGGIAAVNIFLAYIFFAYTYLVAVIVRYKPNIFLAILVTLPFLELGLFFGVMPYNYSFALLISFWIAILSMQFVKKRKGSCYNVEIKIANRVLITLLSVFLIISCFIYKQSDYVRSFKFNEIKRGINYAITERSFGSFFDIFEGEGAGPVKYGELGTIGKVKFDHRTDLKVEVPQRVDGNIYLKGFVGDQYTGDSWLKEGQKYDKYCWDLTKFKQQNLNYKAISLYDEIYGGSHFFLNESTNIKVNNVGANLKYVYAPYNSYFDDNSEPNSDSNIFDFNKDTSVSSSNLSYKLNSFYLMDDIKPGEMKEIYEEYLKSNLNSDKFSSYIKYEKKYRKYVYNEYTKLPKDSLKEIKEKYKGYYKNNSLDRCITEATSVVLNGTKYSLSPGKLPNGKDFVEYFLEENKEGYCTHFASAEAVILRAMGVPTRYVEGYVLNTEEENCKTTNDTEDITVRMPPYDDEDYFYANCSIKFKKVSEVAGYYADDLKYTIDGEKYYLCLGDEQKDISGCAYYARNSENSFSLFSKNYEIINNNGNIEAKCVGEDKKFEAALKRIQSTIAVEQINTTCKTYSLDDGDAHAWVEVYVDGFGWMVVDPTPGKDYDDVKKTKSSALENASAKYAMSSNVKYKKVNKNGSDSGKSTDTVSNQKSKNINLINKLYLLFVIVCSLVVMIIVISIRRLLKRKIKEKKIKKYNVNRQVIEIYEELLEILSFMGADINNIYSYVCFAKECEDRFIFVNKGELLEVTEIINKAKFSNKDIDNDDLEKVIQYYEFIRDRVYNFLPLRKKLIYKYIKTFI